jgi:hypothetical protein
VPPSPPTNLPLVDGVVADVLVARGAGLSLLVAVHAISPVARAAQSNRAL